MFERNLSRSPDPWRLMVDSAEWGRDEISCELLVICGVEFKNLKILNAFQ